jgi:hypothetical protein
MVSYHHLHSPRDFRFGTIATRRGIRAIDEKSKCRMNWLFTYIPRLPILADYILVMLCREAEEQICQDRISWEVCRRSSKSFVVVGQGQSSKKNSGLCTVQSAPQLDPEVGPDLPHSLPKLSRGLITWYIISHDLSKASKKSNGERFHWSKFFASLLNFAIWAVVGESHNDSWKHPYNPGDMVGLCGIYSVDRPQFEIITGWTQGFE